MKLSAAFNTFNFKRRSHNGQIHSAAGFAEEQQAADYRMSISSPASIQSSKVAWLLGVEAHSDNCDTASLTRSRPPTRRLRSFNIEDVSSADSDEECSDLDNITQHGPVDSDDAASDDESETDTVEVPILLRQSRSAIDIVEDLVVPASPLDEAFEVDDVPAVKLANSVEQEGGFDGITIAIESDEEASLAIVETESLSPSVVQAPVAVVVAQQTLRQAPPSPPKSARRATMSKNTISTSVENAPDAVFMAPLKLPVIELTPLVVERDTEYEEFCERMLLERLARPQWQTRQTSSSVSSDNTLGLQTPSLSSSASSLTSLREPTAAQKLQQAQRDQAAHEAKLKLAAARDALKRVKVGGREVRTPVNHKKSEEQLEFMRSRLSTLNSRSMPSLSDLMQDMEASSPSESCASSVKSGRSSRRLHRERDFDGPKQGNVRIGIAAPRNLQAFARPSAAQKLGGGSAAGLGKPPVLPVKTHSKTRSAVVPYKPQIHITSIEELLN
jgi:hypothetical protein